MADLQKPVPKVEHGGAYALSLLFGATLVILLLLVYIGLIGALIGLLVAAVVSIVRGTADGGLTAIWVTEVEGGHRELVMRFDDRRRLVGSETRTVPARR